MTKAVAEATEQRSRTGIIALLCAVLPIGWLVVVVLFYVVALGSSNSSIDSISYALFFASFGVIPLLGLLCLAFCILALIGGSQAGKKLGSAALALFLLEIVTVVVLLTFFSSSDMPI